MCLACSSQWIECVLEPTTFITFRKKIRMCASGPYPSMNYIQDYAQKFAPACAPLCTKDTKSQNLSDATYITNWYSNSTSCITGQKHARSTRCLSQPGSFPVHIRENTGMAWRLRNRAETSERAVLWTSPHNWYPGKTIAQDWKWLESTIDLWEKLNKIGAKFNEMSCIIYGKRLKDELKIKAKNDISRSFERKN